MSKSKDQFVPSTLNFKNGVIFENGATVSEIALAGNINDIVFEEFMRNVLLDDYDQVFETVLYLENCTIFSKFSKNVKYILYQNLLASRFRR